MKNENKDNFGSTTRLTLQALEHLISRGFEYVQVKGFTRDRRQDYMEPYYLILFPIKELPVDTNEKGIYEPIRSKILIDWANSPNDGIEVLVAVG